MDADAFPQEVLADEEPKYLRRQRPLEIKRRKFGRKAWMTYLRVSLWILAALALAGMAYVTENFLLHAPAMTLIKPDHSETVLLITTDNQPNVLSSGADLVPGAYIVRWQALALDGHLTRGDVPFTVIAKP